MIDPGTIYFAIWIAVLISALLTMNLLDSRTGRAIRALRRGHIAAEAFGVQTPRAKLLVFIYAAVLAGLSGWLYAHFERAANPTPFGAQAGIEYLFIAVVGGAGYVWGGVLGAAIVVILKEILQSYLPYLFHGEGQLETIVFGILLVVLLQLAPTGVWPWLMARLPFKPDRKRPDTSLTLPARAARGGYSAVLLQIDHARKQFGGVIAVNDVSFDVQAREIVALIGPNGAGKSTTFNLITGVLTSSGGTHLGARPEHRQRAAAGGGQARHRPHLPACQTGAGHERAGKRRDRRASARPRRRASPACSASTAPTKRNCWRKRRARSSASASPTRSTQLAGSLSLGQQRIVEIARALCVDPILLLLDEPAAGLRHMEKQQLAGLLRQLRDGGMSVLLVEHDMGFVMDLADRIVVLDFGTKIAEGTPACDQDQSRGDQGLSRSGRMNSGSAAAVGIRCACRLRQGRGRPRGVARCRRQRDRHHHRRQRRRQDHAAECHHGDPAAEGPRQLRRRATWRRSISRTGSRPASAWCRSIASCSAP